MDSESDNTLRQVLQAYPKAVYKHATSYDYWVADSLLTDITNGQDISGLAPLADKAIWQSGFAIYSVPPLGYPMQKPILYCSSTESKDAVTRVLTGVG